jgi:hypothetical protein
MLFVPDDVLREVQAAGFEDRRIIAQVRVAAPDVGGVARRQHASDVPEPGVQQLVERLIRDEIVGQGTILGPQLLAGRLGLAGMPHYVELLVMGHGFKRTQPGRDGVVAAWFKLHIVWGICVDQMDRCSCQQPIHVLRLAGVAAQQPMLAKNP